ncbi:MAG: hypothetical protein IJA47_02925 [Oscillospiraceae bacterium]|nr:hypothetical protein [Oscillospiraceae bacterium]
MKGRKTMKLSKKKVVALALAVCLIAILSMGSLAWFTAEDEVTNNFLVGDSTTAPDKVFGIDLVEKVDPDRDGNSDLIGEGVGNDSGAKYETILPGEILPKAPYLVNTGIHPQFVRAIVTVTPASVLKDAMGDDWKKVDLFLAGTDSTKWALDSISYSNDGTNSKFVYVYYYQETLPAGGTTADLFDAVVIPTGLTTDQAAKMGNFEVNIVGQAIQSEHLADPATPGAMISTAKAAFETYWQGVPVYTGASDLYYTGDFAAPIATPENQKYTMMYVEDANVTGEAVVNGENTVATVYLSNVTGDVDNVVVTDAHNTIIIENSKFTLPAGGKLVVDNSGEITQIILYNVEINGVLIDESNYAQYVTTTNGFVEIYH